MGYDRLDRILAGRAGFRFAAALTIMAAILPIAVAWGEGNPDEIDLDVVASVMDARESASLPFVFSFSATETLSGEASQTRTYHGTVAWGRETQLFRFHVRVAKAAAQEVMPATDPLETEKVSRRTPGQLLTFWRPNLPAEAEWQGLLTDRLVPDHFTPAQCGLFRLDLAGKPFSELVRRKVARAVGRENLDGIGPCVKILTDWTTDFGSDSDKPAVLWLSEAHGYYPVRVVFYIHDTNDRWTTRDPLVIKGRDYCQRLILTVQRLVPLGQAWLPELCAIEAPYRVGSSVVRFETDASTVRGGAQFTQGDLMIPAVIDRVVVQDRIEGGSHLYGSGPDDVSAEELDALVAQAHNSGVSQAGECPSRSVPHWLWIVVPLAASLLGAAAWAFRRRRRRLGADS